MVTDVIAIFIRDNFRLTSTIDVISTVLCVAEIVTGVLFLQACICGEIKLFFPMTDAVVVLCLTGRDSAETTEQCRRGGTEMEPESFKLRTELTASESSIC